MERRQHHLIARFGRQPSEVRRARDLVRTSLDSWGLRADAQALELAVSELVTNAVMHGAGSIEVQLSAHGPEVRLEVVDEGDGSPAVRDQRDDEYGGWGLRLVQELADSWGSETALGFTRVWMVTRRAAITGDDTLDVLRGRERARPG